MPARIVRPILLIILGLTFGAAAWQIVQLDRDLDVRSTADAATADALTRCRASMLDLRGVQRAYTAPDQDVRFWRTRAAADLEALVACTGTLEATATAAAAPPATQVALAKLRAAVTATRRLDARMADLAGTGLRDHAYDLLYGDAINASVALERELATAEAALRRLDLGSAAAARRQQATAALAACAVALLVAFVLARMPRAHADEGMRQAHLSVVPARTVAGDADDTPAASAPRLGERAASPAALQAAADVCGALARVEQPLELAGLVERMHGVLDSRGTIVWIYDEGNDALRPGLSAGYASTTIGRMGVIPLSSDTPVATAFTRGEARSVRGTSEAPGALVVPIVTAGGVSGVVTIELPPGNDRQPATLALTRIFAAQLAGLLAVDPRPADVDGPEIVMGAGTARTAAATGDTRERAAGRFADLT
ncbi:MAG TPA: hypothetical protein VNR90_02950 [Vicinamibacterales bacterium]|nr:hypothetical protein [Vicinamibacterales bacterium]